MFLVSAKEPIEVFPVPDVLSFKACLPTATFSSAKLFSNASTPIATLPLCVVESNNAALPTTTLSPPVVNLPAASKPKAVLFEPVVTASPAFAPTATFPPPDVLAFKAT